MRPPQVILSSTAATADHAGSVLTIGNFDGVHLGHVYLLQRVVARARDAGRPALVYTFHPTPQAVLRPEPGPVALLTLEDRVRILGEHGVDLVCVERFSRAYAARSPAWFAGSVLAQRFRPAAMFVGHDFRFGHRGSGDRDSLALLLPDLPLETVAPFTVEGAPVSSSRIRQCLADGRVDEAAALLGRPHRVRGTVVAGDRRGRLLGFPTANVLPDDILLPADGVYAVRVQVDDQLLPGVANLGRRPTVGGGERSLEVHVIVPAGTIGADALYGTEMGVAFVKRVRDELRFPDLEALGARIAEDVAEARRILE